MLNFNIRFFWFTFQNFFVPLQQSTLIRPAGGSERQSALSRRNLEGPSEETTSSKSPKSNKAHLPNSSTPGGGRGNSHSKLSQFKKNRAASKIILSFAARWHDITTSSISWAIWDSRNQDRECPDSQTIERRICSSPCPSCQRVRRQE